MDTSPFISRYYAEGDPSDAFQGLADTSWRFCPGAAAAQAPALVRLVLAL